MELLIGYGPIMTSCKCKVQESSSFSFSPGWVSAGLQCCWNPEEIGSNASERVYVSNVTASWRRTKCSCSPWPYLGFP